ncbi:MAG: cupin-like domain-containing protein [Halioglobus sp.]
MVIAKNTVKEISGLGAADVPRDVLGATEPLVLKGISDDWPAVQAGKSGKAEILRYIKQFCRNKEIVVFQGEPKIEGRFFYNDEMTGFNFSRTTTTFESMLGRFESLSGNEGDPAFYIGSTSVDVGLPGFRQENELNIGGANPLVSIWMGNRTRIAAHCDEPDNIACVVAGRRRFTIFPPDQIGNLYVGPLDFTPAGQAISLVDFQSPDFQRYPRFQEALHNAFVVELEPGDALFLPSLWWHHVEALDPLNVLVNYWWRPVPSYMGDPMDVVIHALLSINALPSNQKRRWREMLDHYVFDDNPAKFSHIPESSLGILANLDETTAGQLRTLLRRKLEK